MKSEDRWLYCLDWDIVGGQIEIYGFSTSVEDYQMFTFDLVPCNYIHSFLGYQNDSIVEGCIPDRKAQETYLGDLRVRILIPNQNFV